MACACKMKERFPIGPAISRGSGELTREDLRNMRLHKGAKPIELCL